MTSRREALVNTATGLGAAGLLSSLAPELAANPLGMPLGCQTYPVRAQIEKDFPATLKELADAGFQRVELCSPVGYAKSGFGGLAKYKPAELQKMLADAGLKSESSHFSMKELRDDMPGRIAWAKEMGLTQMMVPTLSGPHNPTMDDVKRAADEYNKMAEQSAKAGIQQGLH
ncbi:MAG: sugar phosphate isomerase/epimerase family protein, partial [Bryobacteraceae bacterium]